AKAMGRMWLTRPEGSAGRALAFVNASIEKARVRLDAATPGAQRYEVARSLNGKLFLKVFLQIVPIVLSGILGLVILRKLLAGRGVDREMTTFAHVLDGNVTTEMDLQLGDIADVTRAYPAVAFHLRNTEARQVL